MLEKSIDGIKKVEVDKSADDSSIVSGGARGELRCVCVNYEKKAAAMAPAAQFETMRCGEFN